MNKVTNMQVNTVKLLHRAGRVMLCAMALLALGSCRDDLQEPKEKTSEQTSQIPIDNYIGKVNMVIEATLEPMPDQGGRALDFTLIDRGTKIGVDGNTVPSDADYSGEVAPRMYLTEGSTERGFLIFYHDSGKVVRKAVAFKVIEGVKKKDGSIDPTAKNRVQFVGDVDFPTDADVTLADEFNKSSNNVVNDEVSERWPGRINPSNTTKSSGWHVMAMIGYQDLTSYYTYQDADGTDPDALNRMLIGSSISSRYQLAPSESYDDAFRAGNTVQINAPCASAWMPLYITKAPDAAKVTGLNLGLHFKPQGVILQYDLASMAVETQDIRRLGLVSNVLDFKGYYDLNSASIKYAFEHKDAKDYGLPKWVPDAPNMENLSMNYAPKEDAPLSSGARVFPWDMPTLSSSDATILSNWPTPGTNEWKVKQGSVMSVYPLGNSDNNNTRRPASYPWLKASKLWTFYALGGTMKKNIEPDGSVSYSSNSDGRILYFWGMPRTQDRMPEAASERGTYLFASSHSVLTDEDAYDAPNDFDTDVLQDLVNLATDYANDLIDRQKAINAATPENKPKRKAEYEAYKKAYETNEAFNHYRANFPGPTFAAARAAIKKSGEYVRESNKSGITPRTQTLMVLHQTNRTFDERKVYHAQVVIRPDLMLSEVIYQKHDGQNYSLLEVYNTTVEPVDLTQYAVVRLIPSAGTHLAFRGKDGQPVESLKDALVLPLTALKGNANPFEGSALSDLAPTGYNYEDAAKRARPVYYKKYTFNSTRGGFWSGTWNGSRLVDEDSSHPGRSLYLLGGQSILLGASGYVNKPVTDEGYNSTEDLLDPNGWFKPFKDLLEDNMSKKYLRYAYAYADGVKKDNTFGAGTLDYEPGDAFALIKKTSTGWQIIDATGPVGPKHLAFAGSYSDFKTEMAKHESAQSFSLQRLDGVDYPFIAPFRTKRLYPSLWSDDWSIKTEVSQFTPGRRFGYNGWELTFGTWMHHTKRTPIDTQFTAYQNARPTKGF